MKRQDHRKALTVTGVTAFTVLILCLAPFVGMQKIPFSVVLYPASSEMISQILWQIRVPRVSLAFLAGSGLAISGMVFQAMFRNPLATPFTLGVSSGASLGTAIYFRLGLPLSLFGLSGVSVFAFIGALAAILLVYGLSKARGGFSTYTILLTGVAINFFFSSLILFTQYISDFTQSFRILRWLMGGLEIMGFESVLNVLPFLLGGSAVVLYLKNELNLLSTGEDIATSRGVDVRKTRRLLYLATSLMVGCVVAFCGPIGFVGMMAPHICRLLVGPDHRYLVPTSFLFGGAFLTLCDTMARTVIAPAEIPVGIITAMLGGPFFIWLLMRRDVTGRL